jgi:Glutamine amidotransferase class-I
MAGALLAIRYAREHRVPFLGTCGGFQHAVLEYARDVLGWADAEHAETAPGASRAVISPLACALVEALGTIRLVPGTRIAPALSSANRSHFRGKSPARNFRRPSRSTPPPPGASARSRSVRESWDVCPPFGTAAGRFGTANRPFGTFAKVRNPGFTGLGTDGTAVHPQSPPLPPPQYQIANPPCSTSNAASSAWPSRACPQPAIGFPRSPR